MNRLRAMAGIWILVLALAGASLVACSEAEERFAPLPAPTATQETVRATSTLMVIKPTDTVAQPPTTPPEATSTTITAPSTEPATAASESVAQRVQFAPGATSVRLPGRLNAGEVNRYVLYAEAGQQLTLNLTQSGDGSASLVMWGADGTVFMSGAADSTGWSGPLPLSQDYFVDVRSIARGAIDYTLDILVPPAVPQAQAAPRRIQFTPGATTDQVSGALPGTETDRYVLSAAAGQELTLNLTQSGAGHAILALWGADGTVFISGAVDTTSWSGALPFSQDYFVDVRSVTDAPVNYTLDVLIPAAVSTPQLVPQRIQFAPGAISEQVAGNLASEGRARYVLGASAGQELTLNLAQSGGGHAVLAMWGADGTVFMSGAVDATAWSGTLPSTQDYFVDVRSVTSASVSFILEVTIPPAETPSEPVAQRIQFAQGAITAELGDSLPANGAARYVLGASAGQQMNVVLTDTGPDVSAVLVIWGADGAVLLTDHAGETTFAGTLPATQDYFIDVRSITSAPVDFILDVTIPPAGLESEPAPQRIQFAPGATSAQIAGTLPANGMVRHVLGASAGQEMQVYLSDSGEGTNAILIIWGVDGTVLISSHAGATNWVGTLPLTQDYFIDVRSASGSPLDYLLEVVIPPAS